jgi:hypothetical protein
MKVFKEAIRQQFQDLAVALVILIKEAFFALAVFGIGHLLGWGIRSISPEADRIAELLKTISDVGSILLFVVLVGKDLWEYFKNR